MRWVDRLIHCDDTTATVTACFGEDAFCVRDGRVLETALVECMAQAVAAAAGHRARLRGADASPGSAGGGMLAAVSDVRIVGRVEWGQTLHIKVRELKRLGPMLLVAGDITCDGEPIASGELTLYV